MQVIAHGGVEEYEAVLKLFRQSDFSEEQRRCLQAFGATRVPELLVRTLDFALSEEVRTSDVPFPRGLRLLQPGRYVPTAAAARHSAQRPTAPAPLDAGRDIAWQYMKDKWAIFDKKFGGGLFIISTWPQQVIS